MGKFNELIRVPGFERDLKKLKRFRTLEGDLALFVETQLFLYHKLKMDNGGVFRIPGLPFEYPLIYKAKKFACRALKGTGSNSGIRIIYAYEANEDRITLLEIYYKANKSNEDRDRINIFLADYQKERR